MTTALVSTHRDSTPLQHAARIARDQFDGMLLSGHDSAVPASIPATITMTPDRHPALVYLASLAPGSRRTMRHALDTIADVFSNGQFDAESMPWHQLRFEHTAAIRAELAQRFSFRTANKALSALRGVLKAAWRLGYMSGEQYHRATDVEAIKGQSLQAGRMLSPGEVFALAEACRSDQSPIGRRDAALLAVLYCCGLRRSEAVALDVADFDPQSGELKIRAGKGNKSRLVYATNGSGAALRAWISVRGSEAGPLFYATVKGGRILPRRITDQTALDVLAKLATRAKVAPFTPHDLRRTCISTLLDAGADIATVQRLAGHASVNTTQRYDRRPEETKRRAAELIHFPCV